MKTLWLVFAAIHLAAGTLAFAETASSLDRAIGHGTAEALVMKVGDERRFPMPASHALWAQNRKVLSIVAQGSQVVVQAIAEGSTSLQIGEKTFQIQVLQPVKSALIKALDVDLSRMVGLKRAVVEQQVVVQGKLYRWEDWQRIVKTSSDLGLRYAMSADISLSLQSRAAEVWQKQFRVEGLAAVPVHFSRPLKAKLSVSDALFKKYDDILSPYGVILEKDPDALSVAPVVRVQITVAEVRRDMALSYGLKWPSSYQATVLPDGQQEFEKLVFTANALEQKGQGKILASPSLLCRSGKAAEFLAGGEFPIKIMGYRSTDVVWKRYGIVLKVQPTADASGRMSIALETEVSTIDNSRTVDGIPGLLTNRISSHFDLSHSRTIVLSGLIKNEDGKSMEGLPMLSRIPILGALFSSRDFRENRTELVILVRPSIMTETDGEDSGTATHLGDVVAKEASHE